MDQATSREKSGGGTLLASLRNGVVTGAADDDPSAIGTYASAGAAYGLGFLWIAPLLLPMMYAVVYLSAKLGRVAGQGLFAALAARFPRAVVVPLALLAISGNVIEAAADLGGLAASLHLLLPVPTSAIVVAAAAAILLAQMFGSYDALKRVFQWLALALFAYVGAALLARPAPLAVLRGTFVPHIAWTTGFLSMVVACIGTSLSAYIYSWQSNQEVEDQIAEGKRTLRARRGASEGELARTRRDVWSGMLFSNVILYFIVMATGATLNASGHTQVDSAADAARALAPIAGAASTWLFAAGVVGVGFLAVPVMSAGAAYDLVQVLGREGSLHARPAEAKLFYGAIAGVTAIAVALNFLGVNPMRALVWSGIVQGFSVPPLLLLMLVVTSDRRAMGPRANTPATILLGGATVLVASAASIALVVVSLSGR